MEQQVFQMRQVFLCVFVHKKRSSSEVVKQSRVYRRRRVGVLFIGATVKPSRSRRQTADWWSFWVGVWRIRRQRATARRHLWKFFYSLRLRCLKNGRISVTGEMKMYISVHMPRGVINFFLLFFFAEATSRVHFFTAFLGNVVMRKTKKMCINKSNPKKGKKNKKRRLSCCVSTWTLIFSFHFGGKRLLKNGQMILFVTVVLILFWISILCLVV